MVDSTPDFGVIKRPKRKKESNFPKGGKKFPKKFYSLRFFKIVTNYTKLLDYIKQWGYNTSTFICYNADGSKPTRNEAVHLWKHSF